MHYAICRPLYGGCNNGPLYPWLLESVGPGRTVTIQTVAFAVAVSFTVFAALDACRILVRPTAAIPLILVLLSAPFSSWQDTFLTDGLAISFSLVMLVGGVRFVLNDRPNQQLLLMSGGLVG